MCLKWLASELYLCYDPILLLSTFYDACFGNILLRYVYKYFYIYYIYILPLLPIIYTAGV